MKSQQCITCLSVVALLVIICPFICASAAPQSVMEETTPTYTLYFGDLHAHTSFSDGLGTPEDAYKQARDNGADFMATTDHNYILSAEDWLATLAMAESCTENGEFVAIAAFEYFIPGLGEINTFNVPTMDLGVWNPGYSGSRVNALPTYYESVAEREGVGLWVHPTWAFSKEFDDFGYRTDTSDEAMGLLEVHNYGNWEYYRQLDDEPSYIMALDNGWHVMPAATSDTHATNWITGYGARTALLAESLTRDHLYDAMAAGRGYATVDDNLRVDFKLNGAFMGSTLSGIDSTYAATIHIVDPDDTPSDFITKVEIISDGGRVVDALDVNAADVTWTVTIHDGHASYFYIRVSTASNIDGNAGVTAWTAPVWTGR